MYKAKEHEQVFRMHPFGVKYTCELCGKGDMRFDPNSQPQQLAPGAAVLFKHICTECKGVLMLPTMYPKIEWVPEDELEVDTTTAVAD
jgi:hypothetical protein